MGLGDWFRRHRWLISERPKIDAHGDENVLHEEYHGRTGVSRQPPAPYSGPGAHGGLGPVGTSQSDDDVTEDDVEVS
jgi:hypothetical protein